MKELLLPQISYPLPKVKRLPLREQPAYRLTHNPDTCNLTELLAVLVGGAQQIEIAEALLDRFGSIRRLHQAHLTEIAGVKGIGQGTALRLKAALEIGKRAILETVDERPAIHQPADAAALLQYEMSLLDQEYLMVMLLDTRNRVIDIVEAYHGSLNSSQVRVAELFKPAIQRNAAAILILHNHPSTDPTPSPDDVAVTRAIAQVGSLLDIPLIDHIVLGGNGRYVSLKERGVAFDGRTAEKGKGYLAREGEVIDVYTCRQALEDGVLVEVSWMAEEAGLPCPTAITAGLHDDLPSIPRERTFSQSYEDQFWDVLFLARLTARRRIWENPTAISINQAVCPEIERRQHLRMLDMWLHAGPGDNLEPVITIGIPEDS